jgi:hypothetical protein
MGRVLGTWAGGQQARRVDGGDRGADGGEGVYRKLELVRWVKTSVAFAGCRGLGRWVVDGSAWLVGSSCSLLGCVRGDRRRSEVGYDISSSQSVGEQTEESGKSHRV